MAQEIYTRVSTGDQSVEAQLLELRAKYPNANVTAEVMSGAKKRPKLEKLLAGLKAGDDLIVYAIDRLGRNPSDLLKTMEDLEKRGVNFISMREGVDFRTPVGKVVIQILSAVAGLERDILRERTRAGLAAARAEGRVGGRKRTIRPEVIDKAVEMLRSGKTYKEVSELTGVSQAHLARAKKAATHA